MADQRSTESRDDFSERHLVKDRSSEKPRKGDAEAAKGNGSTEATFRDSDAVSNDSSIKENTLTWPQSVSALLSLASWMLIYKSRAAGLMLSEYIVIAILSFPSSYAVLGMAGGVIATLGIGLCVLYTSHVVSVLVSLVPLTLKAVRSFGGFVSQTPISRISWRSHDRFLAAPVLYTSSQ